MHKIISSFFYLISLLLLSFSFISNVTNTQTNSETKKTVSRPSDTSISATELGITASATSPSAFYAKAYCLIDADSGRVLAGKEADTPMPMASTTKIMTCIIALEQGNLSDTVTVSSHAASMPDVQLNMQTGDEFRLEDLLYSLMLESHNDTAVAIAEHIGGSVEGFAKLMNKKAKKLGCKDTQFVTPNGLDAEGHYTTAKELCQIARYALKNETFQKIIQTASYSFSNIAQTQNYTVYNRDAFLTSYEGALGVKTGYTNDAGYCFCGAAKRGKQTLISSVLACGWPPNKSYKWSDTKKLMDYGFEGYQNTTLQFPTPQITLPIENGQKKTVDLVKSPDSKKEITLSLTNTDVIRIYYEIPDTLSAPLQKGTIAGYVIYTLNGEELTKIPLLITEDVDAIDQNYYQNLLYQNFKLLPEA